MSMRESRVARVLRDARAAVSGAARPQTPRDLGTPLGGGGSSSSFGFPPALARTASGRCLAPLGGRPTPPTTPPDGPTSAQQQLHQQRGPSEAAVALQQAVDLLRSADECDVYDGAGLVQKTIPAATMSEVRAAAVVDALVRALDAAAAPSVVASLVIACRDLLLLRPALDASFYSSGLLVALKRLWTTPRLLEGSAVATSALLAKLMVGSFPHAFYKFGLHLCLTDLCLAASLDGAAALSDALAAPVIGVFSKLASLGTEEATEGTGSGEKNNEDGMRAAAPRNNAGTSSTSPASPPVTPPRPPAGPRPQHAAAHAVVSSSPGATPTTAASGGGGGAVSSSFASATFDNVNDGINEHEEKLRTWAAEAPLIGVVAKVLVARGTGSPYIAARACYVLVRCCEVQDTAASSIVRKHPDLLAVLATMLHRLGEESSVTTTSTTTSSGRMIVAGPVIDPLLRLLLHVTVAPKAAPHFKGAISDAVALVSALGMDTTLMLLALSLITNLTFYDETWRAASEAESVLKVLIGVLFEGGADALVEATRACGNITRTAAGRAACAAQRVDEVLLELARHPDLRVAYNSVGALVNLSSDEEWASHPDRPEAVEELAAAIRAASDPVRDDASTMVNDERSPRPSSANVSELEEVLQALEANMAMHGTAR